MNNRRKLIIALGAGALAAPYCSFAQQQSDKVHRIGFLGSESPATQVDRLEVFRAGLRDFGYVEGKNLAIEFRWAEGKYDRLPDLAAEVVLLKPDVLVTFGQKAADAAKRATTTIPIIVPVSTDAVGTGLVASLARPGGNITGSSFFGPELMAKRLELLKETLPRVTRVGALLNPADVSATRLVLQAMNAAAQTLKLSLQVFEVRTPGEFDRVFSMIANSRVEAILVHTDTLFSSNYKTIASLAVKNLLPAVGGDRQLADTGGLISYGPDILALYRRTAYFVDKVVKGAKPSDIPIEQATKFELWVNMKTAKVLGVKVPSSVMVRATKVIE